MVRLGVHEQTMQDDKIKIKILHAILLGINPLLYMNSRTQTNPLRTFLYQGLAACRKNVAVTFSYAVIYDGITKAFMTTADLQPQFSGFN